MKKEQNIKLYATFEEKQNAKATPDTWLNAVNEDIRSNVYIHKTCYERILLASVGRSVISKGFIRKYRSNQTQKLT